MHTRVTSGKLMLLPHRGVQHNMIPLSSIAVTVSRNGSNQRGGNEHVTRMGIAISFPQLRS